MSESEMGEVAATAATAATKCFICGATGVPLTNDYQGFVAAGVFYGWATPVCGECADPSTVAANLIDLKRDDIRAESEDDSDEAYNAATKRAMVEVAQESIAAEKAFAKLFAGVDVAELREERNCLTLENARLVAALRTFVKLANRADEAWDRDSEGDEVSSLLRSLAGYCSGYSPEADAVHALLKEKQFKEAGD